MNTYMNDGVGKRIVDALKKQTEIGFGQETEPMLDTQMPVNNLVNDIQEEPVMDFQAQNQFTAQAMPLQNSTVAQQVQTNNVGFNNVQNDANLYSQNIYSDFSGQNVPANVMILKQLVSQLPSGVSRQAGALVIKQTMEALGISMKTVLQEAQQMQESINVSARECQNSILECKKQINTLEAQVQQYQRQSASLNDIVSLFLQLN